MAGYGQSFANSMLLLWFNGTAIPNLADNAASSPLTNLYVSLHTEDPTSTGDQTTHECAYTSYARVPVARTSSGWTITDNKVVPVADIVFPTCTGGSETAKFFVIGKASSGAGLIMYVGDLNPTIAIANTIVPRIKSTSSIQEN